LGATTVIAVVETERGSSPPDAIVSDDAIPLRVGRVLLTAACALVPCVFWTRWDDVFYLPKLVVLWLALTTVLWLTLAGSLDSRRSIRRSFIAEVDISLSIYIALVVLSAVMSDRVAHSFFGESLQHQGVLTAVLYGGFFYAPRLLDVDERWVLRTFGAIVFGAVGVSAYAVVQRGGFDPLWGDAAAGDRAFSSIGQPNALAAYLVIAITLALALGIWAGRTVRWLLVVSLGLMVFALALTESRGGMLGVAVAVCSVALLSMRSSEQSPVRDPFVRATVVLGVFAFMFVVSHILDREGLFGGGDRHQSIQNHIDVWRVALAVTRDQPLLGIGPETFGDHFHSYSPKVLSPERQWYFGGFRVESPHNAMLGVSSGSGLPALAALLVVIAALVRRLLRLVDSTCDRLTRLMVIGILAAAFGHLVTDSFMTPEIAGSWLFWLLLGIGAQLVIRSDSNTSTRLPRA